MGLRRRGPAVNLDPALPDRPPPDGRPTRVAVIGAGAMGEAHLRAYAATPGVEIVGLATRTPARAAELASRFGIPATFSDPRVLIDELHPDGVSVTTAEHDHAAPACHALERGVGVLLEKPIATSVDDARRIVEAAGRSGAILVPAHVSRFTPPYRALRAEVAAGRIGDVVAIAARRDRTRTVAEHYAHVHPAFLTAVHDIDIILWLIGSKARRVRALERRSSPGGQADLVWAQVEFESGVLASISTAYLHPPDGAATSDRLEVYGSLGVAVVDLSAPSLVIRAEGPDAAPDWLYEPPDGGGAFGAEIAHFADCLRSGTSSNVVSVDDALEGVRIADAVVRSAASDGQDIWL